MIDHNFAFRDEQTAVDDEVVGPYCTKYDDGTWVWGPQCNFNTLIWDPADDTTEIVTGPDGDREIIVHHPLDDQFRVTITLPEADQAMIDHMSLELAVDHENGQMLQTSFTNPQLETLMMQPVFAGSQYPFLTEGQKGLVRSDQLKAETPKKRKR